MNVSLLEPLISVSFDIDDIYKTKAERVPPVLLPESRFSAKQTPAVLKTVPSAEISAS